MPLHEFECPNGHITEKYFPTYAAAEECKAIVCDHPVPYVGGLKTAPLAVECGLTATKRLSTFYGHMYGDGFYKSSEIGPIVNKQDPTKLVKEFTTYDRKGNKVGKKHYDKLNSQMDKINSITRNK